jgi:iron complex outermembrane recepter protein
MSSRYKIVVLALSTSLFTPVTAWAQQAPSEDTNATSGAEIIVSARRRDERLVDAPVAITAIGGDELQDKAITRFTDISTQVPSMVAGRAASGSAASIFLRGVGSTALSAGFDQSVSFVIDNMPMSRGREISLPQFDIQRVEVLKGPQALFFGKNTTGGLISVVSRGPSDEFEAGGRAGYGFEARDKYIEAFVSGPLGENVRARLAGRYGDAKGAFRNSAPANYPHPMINFATGPVAGFVSNPNASRRGFSENWGLRGTLEVQAGEALKLELKVGATGVTDGGPTDVLERLCGAGRTVPQPSSPAPSISIPAAPSTDCRINGVADSASIPSQVAAADYRYARDGRMYADFKSQYGVLKADLDVGAFDITSITSYYHFKQTDLNNVSGSSYPGNFSQLADFDQLTQELRFQSKFDGAFNVLFGGFYSDGKFTFNTDAYILPFQPPPGATYVTFKRDNGFDSESLSLFGEATLNLGEQVELSAGARWSDEKRKSYQRSLAANPVILAEVAPGVFLPTFPGGIVLQDTFKDNDISPQVTLRYKPSRDLTFYAAYKQGFKTGGFNISQVVALPAQFNPAAAIAAGQFGSESAEGFEAGVKSLLMDGDLAFNLTVYRYDYSDLQVQVFDPVAVSLIADNAGKLRTQGIEADFNWRIQGAEGLSLRGAMAYNDAKFRDYVGQCYSGQTVVQGCNLVSNGTAFTSQDYGGRRPPKAPKFAARLGLGFDTPVGSNLNLKLSGDMAHTSSYNFTDTLRPDGVQKAFTKFDASIGVHSEDERWSVSLIGRNLTNKLVVTAANDIPFTGGTGTGTATGVVSDMSAFVENPREIFVEVAFKF